MGTKNISISDEAYFRLAARKKDNESFTDVINRLAGKRSILDLVGLLSNDEARRMNEEIKQMRRRTNKRLRETAKKIEKASTQ